MKERTYESAMEELDEMIEKLESGELTLDESLEVFAEAVKLVKYCNEKLEGARKKMLVLSEELGEVTEKEFREEDYRADSGNGRI
ncbi:MAG: exodeoxyribonuclease VII small subunit [Clostridia bacterium]|nr:exodeoxyribonuclease VII small subunit [Clostridia bacterium]